VDFQTFYKIVKYRIVKNQKKITTFSFRAIFSFGECQFMLMRFPATSGSPFLDPLLPFREGWRDKKNFHRLFMKRGVHWLELPAARFVFCLHPCYDSKKT